MVAGLIENYGSSFLKDKFLPFLVSCEVIV